MPLLTSKPAPATPSRAKLVSPRWWISDKDGNVCVAQWPNPALAVWLLAVIVAWTGSLGSGRTTLLGTIGDGALIAWALDELLRGASPVRRLIGAVVLAAQLVRLFG